jgi:predicted dithiol-disulfide oxidoreductase (DUF899 family)
MSKTSKKKTAPRTIHPKRFPNEPAKYRAVRDKLLKSEIALRRQVEAVAAERRKLPPGGAVREDYVFDSAEGPVKLSALFAPGKDTLLVTASCTARRWPRRARCAPRFSTVSTAR